MKSKSFLLRPVKTSVICFLTFFLCIYTLLMPIRWIIAQTFLGFAENGYLFLTLLLYTACVFALIGMRKKGYTDYASVKLDATSMCLNGFLRKPVVVPYDDIAMIHVRRERKEEEREVYRIIFAPTMIPPKELTTALKHGKVIGIEYTEKRMQLLKTYLPDRLKIRLGEEFRVKYRAKL